MMKHPIPTVVAVFVALSFGCSGAENANLSHQDQGGNGAGGSAAAGGSDPSGTTAPSSGGASMMGGAGTGGNLSSGGASSIGGVPNTGGLNGTGSGVSTGGDANTGGSAAGGSRATGGTMATGGGTSASGGTLATGGAITTGGAKTTGGSVNPGGASATGGSKTAGGTTAIGGSANTDRCDVGVYDSANPPKALTLSGNLGAHDPSAIFQASNNTYYEFQTGLGAKTSTNLTTWTAAAVPFTAPAWLQTSVPGVTDLWAPDISYVNGQYHLYYAGSTFGSNRSCIGHATRASLNTGSWADLGAVICSNVGTSDNWNAIDPNVIIDTNGTPWLDFGSFWSGIKIIQLDQNGARVGTGAPTAIAARPSNGGALEGPFIIRRCGYYYLFMSWDTCCKGASSTYNMRVVRSASVTGPYSDKVGTAATSGGGTLIAQGDATWAGPGGQSVMIVGTKAYLVYHAYTMSNGTATLRIADLVWDASGWPVPVGP